MMRHDTRPRSVAYKGKRLVVEQPGWYCELDPSHDAVLEEADILATEPALLAFRAEVEGSMAPTEVARIRSRLGLSQRQAGRLLGGGPMAFYKYEKGEVAVTRAVSILLRLLDRHPELLAEIGDVKRRAA